jgi:hypothetical protein
MGERNLFMANTPLVVLEAAAAARHAGTRAQLVLLEDFELAGQLAAILRRWRDNPFEAILRLPGRHEEHRRGPGAQRGLAAFARRIAVKRDLRRETMAMLRELDARFEPDAVWVGNDKKVETQYALHLASTRTGVRAGQYLDDGLHSYLGRFRERPLVRRVDELVKRVGYGRWARRVPQIGTSPVDRAGWVAFPGETVDQSPTRRAMPAARMVRRPRLPAPVGARGARVRRRSPRAARLQRGARAAAFEPAARQRGPAAAPARMMETAQACGRRVALKYHPRERESDPAGLLAEAGRWCCPGRCRWNCCCRCSRPARGSPARRRPPCWRRAGCGRTCRCATWARRAATMPSAHAC